MYSIESQVEQHEIPVHHESMAVSEMQKFEENKNKKTGLLQKNKECLENSLRMCIKEIFQETDYRMKFVLKETVIIKTT